MGDNNNEQNLASNLLSPDTEKAVEDLIKSSENMSNTTTNSEKPPKAPASNTNIGIQQNSNDDNFENLQKAVQILGRAKQLDELKRYDDALKLYRQGVDMLLEELIIRQGTEQSRSYLRNKCNDFMNRIDQLKLIIQIDKTSAENKENHAKVNA